MPAVAGYEIYGSTPAIGGIYKGTSVKLILGSGSGDGALKGNLVQNFALQYQRDVTRVWELGSTDTYYIVGRAQGNATLSRIVAKKNEDVLDKLADACSAATSKLTLTSAANACNPNDSQVLSLQMIGPVLTSRSFAIDVNQYVMTSNANIMFAGLEKS